MYKIVAGSSTWFHSRDQCLGRPWGPALDISSNVGQPLTLVSHPGVKAAGCRCCGEASSQCGGDKCKTFTFAECSSKCSAAGSRLCTAEEVLSDIVRGTGCGYDNMHVWTSSEDLQTPMPTPRPPTPRSSGKGGKRGKGRGGKGRGASHGQGLDKVD